MEFLTATIAGIGGFGVLIIAIILLYLLVKFLSLPVKLLYNGIVGALMLWVFNLVGGLLGFTVHINVLKALIAGFFGIPGAAAVILYDLFLK
jgi:inhibitor of the pro-sigma K processing machinery